MTDWCETDEAVEFIASGASRETSQEIMEAIVFFSRNRFEAEELWNGDGFGRICNLSDLWERVTKNGLIDPSKYHWGVNGTRWWDELLMTWGGSA